MHPHILPVLKQLLGAPPTFEGCHAMVKHPHPQRHDEEQRAALLDPAKFGWHRGPFPFVLPARTHTALCHVTLSEPVAAAMLLHSSAGIRPKWGIVDSDKGPGFKNTTFLNNISYFTDIDTVN